MLDTDKQAQKDGVACRKLGTGMELEPCLQP